MHVCVWRAVVLCVWGLTGGVKMTRGMSVQRPSPAERTFTSVGIDLLILDIAPKLKDPDLAVLFTNCLPNALDTTVYAFDATGEDSFLVTGDIKAMWLRDSTNQVLPYLPYIAEDAHLASLVKGLIRRQATSVLIDPYANAFNYNASGEGSQSDIRTPPMTASVFEGKYELDSLAAFLKLSYYYWVYSEDTSPFDDTWMQAVNLSYSVIEQQMSGIKDQLDDPPYLFQRETTRATDTLMQDGLGVPGRRNGLSRSFFRPSDDATTFPFHIPANAMTATELRHVASLLEAVLEDQPERKTELASLARSLALAGSSMARQLWSLADQLGLFAYEVDGYASQYLMDDANIPSLLSLPYLGFTTLQDPLYLRTREFVLSGNNPFFFSGTYAGVGSPHTGQEYVWPMSIMMRALTTRNLTEISDCIEELKASSADTGFMHESFYVDDPTRFTRSWFAWANSLFGEMVLHLVYEYPEFMLQEGLRSERVKPAVSVLAARSANDEKW
jgi:meiotically up-regulated gene 157 (Mug157) protein